MVSKQDVWAMIEKKAESRRERTGDALTKEQAVVKVCEENPELYSQYVAASSVPEVKKQAPAPVRTVKQVAEDAILRMADDIQRRERCERVDAISKAVATKEGRILYDVTRKPEYATMPVEKLTAAVQKSTPVKSGDGPIVPIYKRYPGRAFTYNQIRALERGESPDAA
ncbi:MAG TPA: hypothetical protein VGX03_24150 [Candidatus Binatia bacterium]|jgi:hypothetical protein|nr:hypothetical protein [Candidatus Binatia bacterium]